MKKTKTRDMVFTALLIAYATIVPTFIFLRVVTLPPYTATLTLHVPVMMAMFISPVSAALASMGAVIGFFFFMGLPIVALRAASHIVFAVVGAYMIKKMSPLSVGKLVLVGLVTMILHTIGEIIVVALFLGEGQTVLYTAFYVAGVGTAIHHVIDYMITLGVLSALSRAKLIDWKMKKRAAA